MGKQLIPVFPVETRRPPQRIERQLVTVLPPTTSGREGPVDEEVVEELCIAIVARRTIRRRRAA